MLLLDGIKKWLPRWGWPLTLLLCWAILGSFGHALLSWSWRSSQVDEFERSVKAVASLAGQQTWKQPWETDPAWQALEKDLGIELVPLTGNETQPVTWVRTPSREWRASVTVTVPGSSQGVTAVRGTRIFADDGIDRTWWITWSLLNGVLLLAVMLVRHWQRRQLQLERERLTLFQAEPRTDDAAGSDQSGPSHMTMVMNHLREGVMSLDANLRIQWINQVLCDQLELGTPESLNGRRLLEVVRIPTIVELLDHCQQTLVPTEQTIEVGSARRYLHLLVEPLPAIDAQPQQFLLSASDVSSAQRSELARREFVTGASHELKTPLAAIRAYTETLQSIGNEDPDATERFLEKILDQADRMDRLVNSMLQLARAESGNLKLKVQPIDAALAIKSCIEAAAGMAQAKRVAFESHLPEQRIQVMADRDALQTIASNLLSNAVRYTPSGGRVVLELFEAMDADSGSKWVGLRVSDTGIGIAPVDQARIFERFYRVQKDRAVDSGGTGLGLAIVKQLTTVLAGTVEVISQPGEGTRFEIRLPAVGFTQSSSNAGGTPGASKP